MLSFGRAVRGSEIGESSIVPGICMVCIDVETWQCVVSPSNLVISCIGNFIRGARIYIMRQLYACLLCTTASWLGAGAEVSRPRGVGPECRRIAPGQRKNWVAAFLLT